MLGQQIAKYADCRGAQAHTAEWLHLVSVGHHCFILRVISVDIVLLSIGKTTASSRPGDLAIRVQRTIIFLDQNALEAKNVHDLVSDLVP